MRKRLSQAAHLARMQPKEWIGAIDQGTTSSRFLVFDEHHRIIASAQVPVTLQSPHPGWAQQEPDELVASVRECIRRVAAELSATYGVSRRLRECIRAVGISNQRETTVGWDVRSGRPMGPAIVWLDNRTAGLFGSFAYKHAHVTGLPLSTYFSAPKMAWLLRHSPAGPTPAHVRFGTVDSWLGYSLLEGRPHQTDATNASRTLLYSLETGRWDPDLLQVFGIPPSALPRIVRTGEPFGVFSSETELAGVPLTACLGDQHAALLGHGCTEPGMTKLTYGTGCFLLQHSGKRPVQVPGLLATLASSDREFAVECPIAMAGVGLSWLRNSLAILPPEPEAIDQMGLLSLASESEVVFLPALSGLLAPYWDSGAKASFHNLTLETGKAHLVLAVLESIAFSCRQACDLIAVPQQQILADGGLTRCRTLMQIQAALLPPASLRVSECAEATALGAATAAASAAGLWQAAATANPAAAIEADEPLRRVYEQKYQRWLGLMEASFCESRTRALYVNGQPLHK